MMNANVTVQHRMASDNTVNIYIRVVQHGNLGLYFEEIYMYEAFYV